MRERFASTKFLVPPAPNCYVARPRLHEALDQSRAARLTSVVGPAGSGKTVAVASWVASRSEANTAWLSCDERDADPSTFWRATVEALDVRWPAAWIDSRDVLDDDEPPLRDVAIALANDASALDEPVTLVIDDFHVAKDACPSLTVAIDALPASARLVLVGRTDPMLPLHRMRARQELLELREEHLRLLAHETGALTGALGLGLDACDATLLHERTNGWMAAVHLASISLRGRDDVHEFIDAFSGENRLVAEFLVGEVLSSLPSHLERFLEDSSVLDELDGPACRAVTGVADSAEILQRLSAQNMLVAPRGDGYTYRYHQLFRDLLQYRLRANSPERFVALQKVAAQWYEARGELDRAAKHLTTAGDDRAAFELLGDHAVAVFASGGIPALDRFVAALDLRQASVEPTRAIDVALVLALTGAIEEAERWIARAEQTSARLSRREVARLAIAHASVATLRGDAAAALAAAEAVDTDAISDDPVVAALPVFKLRARLWLGDVAGSRDAAREISARPHETLEINDIVMRSAVAWTACVEGCLREADGLASDAIAHAARIGTENHAAIAEALRAQGRVRYERGQFEAAEPLLERSIAISERTRRPYVLFGQVALARLLLAQSRAAEAAAALEHARGALAPGSESPLHALVIVGDVQLALATGEPALAIELLESLPASQRKTRIEANVALAVGDGERGLAIVETLEPASLRERLDAAVLRTRALHAIGRDDADDSLRECIALARPEEFVVALAHDIPELENRVSFHLRSASIGEFEQAVLDALDRPRPSVMLDGGVDLVEQLTARELTVLRYLGSRLTVNEIAAECYVSPNTLKTHVKAVYRKLGVSSRREAVDEGRRLQLL